jgi:hypothetical protein
MLEVGLPLHADISGMRTILNDSSDKIINKLVCIQLHWVHH